MAASTLTTSAATTKAATSTSSASSSASSTADSSPKMLPFTYSSSLSTGVKAAYIISYILLIFLCLAVLYFLAHATIQYRRQPRGTKESLANDPTVVGTHAATSGHAGKMEKDIEEGDDGRDAPEIQAVH